MSTCGIMNPSFFVGKAELLRWVNDFFQLNYTKVEQACTGALHCQILDAIFPGKVALHKVNFNATQEYQYVNNYKVLQSVFNKQKITKHVDVQKLIRGKYQDNLEFLQWMKHFFETRYSGQDYDAAARRQGAMKRYSKGRKHASTTLKTTNARTRRAPQADNKENTAPRNPAAARRGPRTSRTGAATGRRAQKSSQPRRSQPPRSSASSAELAELNQTIENLAKERNFYFNKLREVEIMCRQLQEAESDGENAPSEDTMKLCSEVLDILYKEEDDFVAPTTEEQEA